MLALGESDANFVLDNFSIYWAKLLASFSELPKHFQADQTKHADFVCATFVFLSLCWNAFWVLPNQSCGTVLEFDPNDL